MTDAGTSPLPGPRPDQRITLVTGASRGLGRAVAIHLAKAGHHIIATARTERALLALDDELRSQIGHPITLLPLDLRDMTSIDRLGMAIYERFGRLDGLAAIGARLGGLAPVQDFTSRGMEETMTVNFMANWRLLKACDALLKAAPAGRVAVVSSSAVRSLRPYWAAYAASKAALEAMVQIYAKETAHLALKVNLFDPGPMATKMRAEAFPSENPDTLPSPTQIAPDFAKLLLPECAETGALIRVSEPA